jgi:hypothetical protein
MLLGEKLNANICAGAAQSMVVAAIEANTKREGLIDAQRGKEYGEAFAAAYFAIVNSKFPDPS